MRESSGTNRSCDLTIFFIDPDLFPGASIGLWKDARLPMTDSLRLAGLMSESALPLSELKKTSGDHSGGVTPDPIPNSAVKPSSADGTARVNVW